MDFQDWTPKEPAQVVDLRPPGAFIELINYYAGSARAVVEEVIGQAYSLGAQMAVVEYRYLDADYRSEHSRFYSTTFRRYPSVAHRIHFFEDPPSDELLDPNAPYDFSGLTYLGYTVFRPLPGARVGRTMLRPPPTLQQYITCQAEDAVNIFGHTAYVRAAPFMAQDAQLGVCAHMTIWTTSYFHHLAFGHPRALPRDVADAVPAGLGLGRPSPSTGLTVAQIAAGSLALDRPALVYHCDKLPSNESIPRIACRYLNSAMPVIVTAGGRHAFVLVGYRRDDPGTSDERIRFIVQDDERGPYQTIDDFKHDRYGRWDHLVVPLPQKVFVPGEVAEELGNVRIRTALREMDTPEANELLASLDKPSSDPTSLAVQSAVMLSNRFKTTVAERGASADVAALYRRMQLPRWVWVVEAIRRGARNERGPGVEAEIILDATDHSRDLQFRAMRVPGRIWSWLPDTDRAAPRATSLEEPYQSVTEHVLQPPRTDASN